MPGLMHAEVWDSAGYRWNGQVRLDRLLLAAVTTAAHHCTLTCKHTESKKTRYLGPNRLLRNLENDMGRLRMAGVVFVSVGAIAALTVTGRGAFVMGFFVLFFGGIAAALVLLSGGRWNAEVPEPIDIPDVDPFVDQDGVRHSSPQALSPPTTTGPGAHARI